MSNDTSHPKTPTSNDPSPETLRKHRIFLAVLALGVGAVSVCGIIYQLIIGSVSTYLQGNSTYQYSITIGLFMSAYGLGSFLSTRVRSHLLDAFILVETFVGLVGGLSSVALFYLYATSELFTVGRFVIILLLGTLVGLEIPLLVRITEDYRRNLRLTIGQMMGFDYLGALLGGIGFPIILLPSMGLVGSCVFVGLLNSLIAFAILLTFRKEVHRKKILWASLAFVTLSLGTVAVTGRSLEQSIERNLYQDPIVYIQQTPYQKIVLTREANDVRLYLDGSLQFSSSDEYRYHEALVHPAASRLLTPPKNVLILGGGDGLAARELLPYASSLESVTLIDLDPAMTKLASSHPLLTSLNQNALTTLRVNILPEDAFNYARTHRHTPNPPQFDLILIDLPDPHNEALAKLYSLSFYSNLKRLLRPEGLVAAQIGSPFFGNRAFWSSVNTLRAAGWTVFPYRANVPSFGEWGFALAALPSEEGSVLRVPPVRNPIERRFINPSIDASLFHLPNDLKTHSDASINTLIRPIIVDYFRQDWRAWN